MKKGDKIYCIKTAYAKSEVLNIQDKIYEIDEIGNDFFIVTSEKRKNIIPNFFNYRAIYYMYSGRIFSEHFISLKDIRSQKLQKINNL